MPSPARPIHSLPVYGCAFQTIYTLIFTQTYKGSCEKKSIFAIIHVIKYIHTYMHTYIHVYSTLTCMHIHT